MRAKPMQLPGLQLLSRLADLTLLAALLGTQWLSRRAMAMSALSDLHMRLAGDTHPSSVAGRPSAAHVLKSLAGRVVALPRRSMLATGVVCTPAHSIRLVWPVSATRPPGVPAQNLTRLSLSPLATAVAMMVAALAGRQGEVMATVAVVTAVAMGEGTAAQGVVTAAAMAVVVAGMEMATGTAMAMAMAMAERIPASRAIRSIRAMCRCPTWIHPFPAATKGSGPVV